MAKKKRRARTGPQLLPRPINVLLRLAEKGTSANKRECLRLAELELPERFPRVVCRSRQALLRRIALDEREAADLRRQCLVELIFGLSVGTQVQQALEVRVSRPRRKKTVQKTDEKIQRTDNPAEACLAGDAAEEPIPQPVAHDAP